VTRAYLLLVDDDADDIELALLGLSRAGFPYPVEVANGGDDALHDAQPHASPGVLLDVKMPRMSGLELLRRLREHPHLAAIPAAFLTSSSHEADRTQAEALGARLYMNKPADLNGYGDVAARLKRLVGATATT
jgi:two-component system, response regulator